MSNTGIVQRYVHNPILQPADMPEPCCAVYNSGVVKTPSGEYIMASRFETLDKTQKVWVSRSHDGIHFTPDPQPVAFVCRPEDEEEYNETVYLNGQKGALIGSWYDPRICVVEGEYYITYCVGGDYGCRIAIGKTEDFRTVEHISFPLHILNRNAVTFPREDRGGILDAAPAAEHHVHKQRQYLDFLFAGSEILGELPGGRPAGTVLGE